MKFIQTILAIAFTLFYFSSCTKKSNNDAQPKIEVERLLKARVQMMYESVLDRHGDGSIYLSNSFKNVLKADSLRAEKEGCPLLINYNIWSQSKKEPIGLQWKMVEAKTINSHTASVLVALSYLNEDDPKLGREYKEITLILSQGESEWYVDDIGGVAAQLQDSVKDYLNIIDTESDTCIIE